MRKRFHQSLDELKEKLLVMAGFAEQAIQRSIEAYRTRDPELVELVRRSEPAINRLEREIDSTALDLLDTEAALSQAELARLQAAYAYVMNNYTLKRATGEVFW